MRNGSTCRLLCACACVCEQYYSAEKTFQGIRWDATSQQDAAIPPAVFGAPKPKFVAQPTLRLAAFVAPTPKFVARLTAFVGPTPKIAVQCPTFLAPRPKFAVGVSASEAEGPTNPYSVGGSRSSTSWFSVNLAFRDYHRRGRKCRFDHPL